MYDYTPISRPPVPAQLGHRVPRLLSRQITQGFGLEGVMEHPVTWYSALIGPDQAGAEWSFG
jgi:hypothetical protein